MRLSLLHPDSLGHLGLPGYPVRSDEQRALSAPSIRGRSPYGSRFLDPSASPPDGDVLRRRPSASRPLAFRISPECSGWIPSRFPKEGPFFAERRPGCLNNPGRSRWRVGLFRSRLEHIPTGTRPHPFSGCLPVQGRRRHRFRAAGQLLRSRSFTRVAPCARTWVGCPSQSPPEARGVVVADKTRMERISGNPKLCTRLEINIVGTCVIHNCGQHPAAQDNNRRYP